MPRRVENPEYVEINAIMINNAIRIYQHWKLNLCQYSGHQKCDSYAAPAV